MYLLGFLLRLLKSLRKFSHLVFIFSPTGQYLALKSCDVTIARLIEFINRGDGRTLNQAYIELPDLISGQSLIRTKNGKKICGRIISVVLSSQEDLLRQVSEC